MTIILPLIPGDGRAQSDGKQLVRRDFALLAATGPYEAGLFFRNGQ